MPDLISMAATSPPVARRPKPAILLPFDLRETMLTRDFCAMLGVSQPCGRETIQTQMLARKVGGRWYVSKVLAAMYLDGDREAMKLYWAGDRESEAVARYYRRFGIDPATLGQGA